jgi:predicted dehydrogenase
MLAGNNRKKTEYILRSVRAGYHVFADKPMAIDTDGYRSLEKAFRIARR